MINFDEKNFSEALDYLKEGHKVTRAAWPENMFVVMKKPKGKPDSPNCTEMTYRYLCMQRPKGGRVPWLPGFFEIFANDYMILEKPIANQAAGNTDFIAEIDEKINAD